MFNYLVDLVVHLFLLPCSMLSTTYPAGPLEKPHFALVGLMKATEPSEYPCRCL